MPSASRLSYTLAGEMAGRVVRVLIDCSSPHALASLATEAQVRSSVASRVLASLQSLDVIARKPRGMIEGVHWQDLLRRWCSEAPPCTRRQQYGFAPLRTVEEFALRLSQSGLLHALTADAALSRLTGKPMPTVIALYVDDVAAAASQFQLHPASDNATVVLLKPSDRSVFHRSVEAAGLRYVSPSLMAADLCGSKSFDSAIAWMAEHEADWRHPHPLPRLAKAAAAHKEDASRAIGQRPSRGMAKREVTTAAKAAPTKSHA